MNKKYLLLILLFINGTVVLPAQMKSVRAMENLSKGPKNAPKKATVVPPKPHQKTLVEDSDGDGLADSKDNCPNEYGEIANYGCPMHPALSIGKATPTRNYTEIVNGVRFDMIRIEGGSFEMGSDYHADERPIHTVSVTSYNMAKTEVTQALWQTVMGNNPSTFKANPLNPVENVSWEDCQAFIKKLNRLTGRTYRLPTEAEWEYAARGGVLTDGQNNDNRNKKLDELAWHSSNSGAKTHAVGLKQPNELGLYDLFGNVWEWCNDWYDEEFYSKSTSDNPKGPLSGSYLVNRGGGWRSAHLECSPSQRGAYSPTDHDFNVGLRLVSQ